MDYRRDIDGLRAIAVLAIVFFHADFPGFPGGYRGVDMFFVISGFLITGILLRERAAGTFTLARFYERRARRILPALFVVLAVIAAAAYWVMLPADLKLFAQNLVAIVLFASNILFWFRAGGFDFYFEPSARLNPALHTWSLGVEEQFYLVFPLLVALGWRFRRRKLFLAIVITAVASFTLGTLIDGQWNLGIRSPREATFYLLPSRAWQLMIGAIVAFWNTTRPPPEERDLRWSQVAAGCGLGLIVFSMMFWTVGDYDSPTVHSLPAVAGTALILASGPGTVVASLLSWGPLVGVGLISYSLYLWHQPLFAFAHYVSLDDVLSISTRVALVFIALGTAWVSWRFIERPFRDRRRVSLGALVTVCVVAGGCLLAVGVGVALNKGQPTRGRLLPTALVTTLTTSSLHNTMRDCAFDTAGQGADTLGCALNPDSTAAPSFVVVGDSHAGAMFPAFQRLAQQTGQQGRLVALGACPPLLGIRAELERRCLAMQPKVLDYVTQQHIKHVFLVARWSGYTDGNYAGRIDFLLAEQTAHPKSPRTRATARQTVVEGLKRTIAAYTAQGVSVYVVTQIPRQIHRPLGIYLQSRLRLDPAAFIRSESVTREQHETLQQFMTSTFAPYRNQERVKFIDLAPVLCDGSVCPVGTAGQSYYWDDDHLSDVGAIFVSEALRRLSFGESRDIRAGR